MPRKPTSLFSLIAYSGPAIPLAMLGLPLILYLPPFYAGELGMDLAAVGGVFALARMWDAIIDPLIGYWSDRTGGRFGRRKPWLVAGAPLWMLGVYALLSPPEGVSTLYLWFSAFGFYVAWTMVQIPYQSWGVELSRQYEERSRITGIRETGTLVGVILATAAPVLVFSTPNPPLRDILWVLTVALMVLIPATVLITCLVTPAVPPIVAKRPGPMVSLRVLSRNRPLLRVLVGSFCMTLAAGVLNSGLLFLWAEVLELSRLDFLVYVLVQYGFAVVGMPLMVWLGNRIGRHRALAMGGGGFLALQLVLLAVTPGAFEQVLAVAVVGGLITSVIWVMPPALVGDTVEYGMLKGGGDQAALYMAALNFVSKMAFAAGVGIALPLLAALGFDAQGGNDPDALFGLKMVVIVLPLIPGLLGAAVLFNHKLTASEHAAIRRRLAERGIESGAS